MEQIIYITALVVYAVFIIRFILSWVGADFDLDDADLDLSDIVSFKGLTHFLMGSSGWLSIKCYTTHSIMWYDYLIALVIGLLFVIILFYLYKFMLKLEHAPLVSFGKDLIGRNARIYIDKGKENDYYKYIITIYTNNATLECDAKSLKHFSIGDIVNIIDYDGSNYIVL